MNILILHALGDPFRVRRTTFNQTFCLPKYAPAHEYLLHCHDQDFVGRELVEHRFDVIVLDTTFLCLRWVRPRRLFDQILRQYDFVGRSSALKIAFPQDDYDHSRLLDGWLSDWGVKIVFSPLARFKDVLYPRTARGAEIMECLTGHVDAVDEAIFERWRKPHAARSIDVGSRAKNLPKYFGRLGRLKSEIGSRFKAAVGSESGLRLDISNRADATLLGAEWLRFLGDSKFTLGSISGSSVLDPDGSIQDCVRAYEKKYPNASFEEVERACFPGLEGKYEFAALGPRNVEAALAKSCQILVSNPGWLPLKPRDHFIPVDADCANVAEVLEAMANSLQVEETVEACYDLIVRSGAFSYETFVSRILGAIDRCTGTSDATRDFAPAARRGADIVEHLMTEQRLVRMTFGRTAEREIALRRELALRTGRRGAIRELFRANEYWEHSEDRAATTASVPLLTRMFFVARRICNGLITVINVARNATRKRRTSSTRPTAGCVTRTDETP